MTHLSRESGPLLCCFLLLLLSMPPSIVASDWEIDATGTVERIVDGDTFGAVPVGRVRLADIDTPEVGEPGAQEATDYLASLVCRRLIYLDVDDLLPTDVYGRIVAVVYLRHNATHLLNVNEALLRTGLATEVDFPNDFSPDSWTLYVHHPAEKGPMTEILAAAWTVFSVVISILALSVVFRFLRSRCRSRSLGSEGAYLLECEKR